MADATPTRHAPPSPATPARLSLGNSSPAQSTVDHLRFQLDHALARDAVHTPLDLAHLTEGLRARNLTPLVLRSAASDPANGRDARATYLRRPDLGRTLHPDSLSLLRAHLQKELSSRPKSSQPHREDAAERPAFHPGTATLILLADGLSALALERHALPLLDALLPLIPAPCPLVPLAQHARVALADEVGHHLSAALTVLLIGERPGLSSPDSLGCYITWSPRPGRTDAERNCISNIRGPQGLSYLEAAHRIAHYIREAQRLQTTGITLKDPDPTPQQLG